jgi:hypothetical protein
VEPRRCSSGRCWPRSAASANCAVRMLFPRRSTRHVSCRITITKMITTRTPMIVPIIPRFISILSSVRDVPDFHCRPSSPAARSFLSPEIKTGLTFVPGPSMSL